MQERSQVAFVSVAVLLGDSLHDELEEARNVLGELQCLDLEKSVEPVNHPGDILRLVIL